jgi:uncharacterized protein (TIGR02231 family)
MRHSIICITTGLFLFMTCGVYAQIEYKLNIKEATVFLSGAELVSSASVSLSQGENEILFNNVAGDINIQSITVSAGNGVAVESVTFQNNYMAPQTFSPQVKGLQDSIELLTGKKEDINNKISVVEEQIAVLQANRKVSGDNTGLSVAELSKMLELTANKWNDLLTQKTKLKESLKKADETLVKLKNQEEELQRRANQPEGVLRVKFYAKEGVKTTIETSYVVPDAGWAPTYDIYADNINSPVKLYYKANIHQGSGVNWNNVHLSLSTGNPVEGAQAPGLDPWYLALYHPQAEGMPVPDTEVITDPVTGSKLRETSTNSFSAGVGASSMQWSANAGLTGMGYYVSVDNSGVSTTFDIDLPYTIPCDGQQHLVTVKESELPASYRYFVIPKKDKDAFLQAEITKWEDLNLLPGQTNIFYEGTYVGQGYIDVRNLKDTLDISLGRDKKIVVKRDEDKNRRSAKALGGNVREAFAYTISVRNTRKEGINLIVEDQQPVSNDKDVVIEDAEAGDSDFDKTTGMMKWTLSIAPNETKKLSFGYTVKYPKGKTVLNLK